MAAEPPNSPFQLTRQRVVILVLGALALILIVGSIMGGVGNYQLLRESVTSSSQPPSASSPSAG